jgi:hypothetical protein
MPVFTLGTSPIFRMQMLTESESALGINATVTIKKTEDNSGIGFTNI